MTQPVFSLFYEFIKKQDTITIPLALAAITAPTRITPAHRCPALL